MVVFMCHVHKLVSSRCPFFNVKNTKRIKEVNISEDIRRPQIISLPGENIFLNRALSLEHTH